MWGWLYPLPERRKSASPTPIGYTTQTDAIFGITVFRGVTQINMTAIEWGHDPSHWAAFSPGIHTIKFLVEIIGKRAALDRNISVTHQEVASYIGFNALRIWKPWELVRDLVLQFFQWNFPVFRSPTNIYKPVNGTPATLSQKDADRMTHSSYSCKIQIWNTT